MIHAVLPRQHALFPALLAGALALLFGALVTGSAHAATPLPSAVICGGHVNRGVDPTQPDRLDYLFRCSGDITSYTLISSAPIGGFDVGAEVFDHGTQTIVQTDSLLCEGMIPGDGFNCTGHASSGKDVRGAFELSDPMCVKGTVTPTPRLQLVVADTNGATAGPFRLHGLQPCPKPRKTKAKSRTHHAKRARHG
jgi:hypothetical protein